MNTSPLNAAAFATILTLLGFPALTQATEIRVPADEPSIEAALAVALPGDEIVVAEDIYELDDGFTITTENITLRSEVSHGAVLLLTTTFTQLFQIEADGFQLLDFGSYCPRIFTIAPDVEGTVIRNNKIFAFASTSQAFSDRGIGTRFEDNHIQGFLGMGHIHGEAAHYEGNLFLFNATGLDIAGEVTLFRNRFERNASYADDGSSGLGGALNIRDVSSLESVRILENEFDFNVTDVSSLEAPGQGGAIYLKDVSAIEIIGNVFTHNQSRTGAALFAEDSNIVLRDNVFYANSDSIRTESDPTRGYGGALRLEDVTGEVSNNTFVKNRAGLGGGAISLVGTTATASRREQIGAR